MPDVPYQLDDMNADGIPDELVLLLDMKPSETRRFKVRFSAKEADTVSSLLICAPERCRLWRKAL